MTARPLHVDRHLTDPLALPIGLAPWLRAMELRARGLHAQVWEIYGRAPICRAFEEAAEAIERFVFDDQASLLIRALKRPLRQLAPNTTANKSLDRYATQLFEQVELAIRTQSAFEELHLRVSKLVSTTGTRLPTLTAQYLGEARLTAVALERVNKLSDIERMHRRCRWVEDKLSTLLDGAPDVSSSEISRVALGPQPRPEELRALRRLRMRQRDAIARRSGLTAGTRLLIVRHQTMLDEAASASHAPSQPLDFILERLSQTLSDVTSGFADHEDVLLGVGMVGKASEALRAGLHEASPRRTTRQTGAAVDRDASVLYVIPIDDRNVLVTRNRESPIRLWTTHDPRPNQTVPARVFAATGKWHSQKLAELDIAPLFEGVAIGFRWLRNVRDASIRLVAEDGEDWFGVIEQRGRVAPTDVAAWKQSCQTSGALRVLRTPEDLERHEIVPVGLVGDAAESLFGFTTRRVLSPLADTPFAWLRTDTSPEIASAPPDREFSLFRLLHRRHAAFSLRALAAAQVEGERGRGFLYAPVLALRTAEAPPLLQWLSNPTTLFDCLRSVARVLIAVRETGYSLGACHLDMFAFAVDWDAELRHAKPRAILYTAPLATPFGSRFGGGMISDSFSYPRLRFRGVDPEVVKGAIASPKIDAVAFAVFALEVLATKSVVEGPTALNWDLLPAFVEAKADVAFADPAMAREFAAALKGSTSPEQTWKLIEKLASEK